MNLDKGMRKLESEQFDVKRLDFMVRNLPYTLVAVTDINPETNLTPYQNTSYYLINPKGRAMVVDPGIRNDRGDQVRDTLEIEAAFCVLTHYHLDHWIGFEAYRNNDFYATQRCIDVLTGKGDTSAIKVFDDGRITWGHTREAPQTAIEDARNYLPLTDLGLKVYTGIPDEFPVSWYELPGQSLGTMYGVTDTDLEKMVFAGDLFIELNDGKLVVEPHYSEEIDIKVMANTAMVLKAMMGLGFQIPEGYESYPNLKETLSELEFPKKLLLGHSIFDMNKANLPRILYLINRLEDIIKLHEENIV